MRAPPSSTGWSAPAAAGGPPTTWLDEDAIRELAPDVILTQDLCAVCAVPAGAVDAALERLGCSAQVVSLDPTTLDEVLDGIARVGAATGRDSSGLPTSWPGTGSGQHAVRQVVARPAAPPGLRAGVGRPACPVGAAMRHWIRRDGRAAGGTPVLAVPGGRSHRGGPGTTSSRSRPAELLSQLGASSAARAARTRRGSCGALRV